MVGLPVVSPGIQGQGKNPTTPLNRRPSGKDATGSVLRASEKELIPFTLKIPNAAANLDKVHKAFIDDLYRATQNDVTLIALQ